MHIGKRRTAAIVSLAFLAAGCASQPESLVELPTYQLDLASSSPRTYRPKPAVARRGETGHSEWAAKGQRLWRYIVIHHSATDTGSAEIFDSAHRARGWDELGYHFVINNGNGRRDGLVEVGSRWRSQKWGAHCGGTPDNEYNNHGIGICLVGEYGHHVPSMAQMASLEKLLLYLMRTYDIPTENIIGHCDAPNACTKCPGSALHAWINSTLRMKLARHLAAAE